MRIGVSVLAAALDEIAGDVDLLRSPVRFANRNTDGSGAVKEIVVDLVAVAAHDHEVLFAVPFNAVADKSDRGIFATRGKACALVTAEPVVEDEGIPSAHAHAIAVVVGQLAVPHAEAPDAIEPHAIAGEAGVLAAFDAEAVLVLAPFGAVGIDAMNACAEKAPIESKPIDCGSACLGQVEQAA